MTSLAIAMPSTSSSARSAPKMRSALSALLAQSGGSSCVSVLMMRRFWSAAVVRSEAFQSQSATMMTNARTSAVALNVPRPAHLARKIACRFTSGERLCAGVSPSARGYFNAWYGKDGPQNYSFWDNTEFQALAPRIDREVDAKKRLTLIRQAEAVMEQDPPLVPVAWEKINDVWYNYRKGHNPAEYFGIYDVVRLDTVWLDKA